jgi:CheY-like chemotaxis protein
VLYVDDEAMLVDLARRQLAIVGYEVDGYTDAEAALAAFREHPDRYDVLITDLTMPAMSGLDLATALHAIRPELPIVLLSGYIETTGTNATPEGVDVSLPKPTSLEALASAVASALSGTNRPDV